MESEENIFNLPPEEQDELIMMLEGDELVLCVATSDMFQTGITVESSESPSEQEVVIESVSCYFLANISVIMTFTIRDWYTHQ